MPAKRNSQYDTELVKAARNGDLKRVKQLIKLGADVNFAPPSGTPLRNALRAGHLKVMKELIEAGANPDDRGFFGSIVELAVEEDRPDALKLLLESGAYPGGAGGASPLLRAVTTNRPNLARILIDARADVNEIGSVVCGDFGKPEVSEEVSGNILTRTTYVPNPPIARDITPLIVAVRRGYVDITRLLLDAKADLERTDKEGLTALGWALRTGNEQLIQLLQACGAKTPEYLEGTAVAALFSAAQTGDTRRIKALLERGIDVNSKYGTEEEEERTALIVAGRQGHEDTVEFLIEAGADVNLTCGSVRFGSVDKPALLYAAEAGHLGVVRLLVERGARVNAKEKVIGGGGGKTAIHYAAESGHADVVGFLIDAGLKVDGKTSDRTTALLLAASAGHKAAVELLLRKGADVNAEDRNGFTPLVGACSNGLGEIVKVLLNAGANPDKGYPRPLEMASSSGQGQIVEMLLKAGASLDIPNKPPLVTGALMGGPDVIEVLLSAGATPNIADGEGFTPLMGAVRSGRLDSVKMLLAAGADVNAVNKQAETALDLALDNIQAIKDQAKFLRMLSTEELSDETHDAIKIVEQIREDEIVTMLEGAGGRRGREVFEKKDGARVGRKRRRN